MDQLATCMAKETEAQACGPPGQWGLDGDLLRCRTSLCILQQSPGKQPVLAMDYITVCAFSLCASSQELLFLLKNPTAINLPEWRFPVKKKMYIYIYLHSHLQISNQFEATQNCSEEREVRCSGLLIKGKRWKLDKSSSFSLRRIGAVCWYGGWESLSVARLQKWVREFPSHYQLIKGSLRYSLCPTHQVCMTTSETLTDS